MKQRCFGNKPGQDLYAHYHDYEWGIPAHDDKHLFEMLVLEGAQAGLSWETILKRREGYRSAFAGFDVNTVANLSDNDLQALVLDSRIIRNRLKIASARNNARIFLDIQREQGSFDTYLWTFVDGKPIQNHWLSFSEVPVTTAISDALSRDLKRRGMRFLGSTIMYAYMQAVGLVNDHPMDCWRYGAI